MSKLQLQFANEPQALRFSLSRYLVDRFPPLGTSSSAGRIDPNSALAKGLPNGPLDLVHRLDWEDDETGRHLRGPGASELSGWQTVQYAITQLDAWIVATLRKALTRGEVEALAGWLADQWRPYWLTEAMPDSGFWCEYFWNYIRLLGNSAIKVGGRNVIAPPLVGWIEVHPATLTEDIGFDGDVLTEWPREQIRQRAGAHGSSELFSSWTRVSLCDCLTAAFPARRTGSRLCLVVRYRGQTCATDYLQQNEAFWYRFLNLHPRDHWAVRDTDVKTARAESTLSGILPACIRAALREKLPHVNWLLEAAASDVADWREPLATPFWLHPAVLRATAIKAQRELTAKIYDYASMDRQEEYFGDGPFSSTNRESLRQLLDSGDDDELVHARTLPMTSQSEDGILASTFMHSVNRLYYLRMRALATQHRDLLGVLENVVRWLPIEGFPDKGKIASDLDPRFCSYVALWHDKAIRTNALSQRKEKVEYTHPWSDECYNEIITPWLDEMRNGTGSINLFERAIESAANYAKRYNDDPERVRTRLKSITGQMGEPTDSVRFLCDGSERAFKEMLFIGKLLIQLRNLTQHGTIEERRAGTAHGLVVCNRQKRAAHRGGNPKEKTQEHVMQFELTPATLEAVFRSVCTLIVAIFVYSGVVGSAECLSREITTELRTSRQTL